MRSELKNNYTIIPNKIINDPTLSLKAKGLWVYLQSKSNGQNFSIDEMRKHLKEGKSSIQGAIWELEKAGLLVRKRVKDNKGKWIGYKYFLYENKGEGNEKNICSQ